MDEGLSPLPEFSQLVMKASQAVSRIPDGPMSIQDRMSMINLIAFVRDYDYGIVEALEK